MKGLQEAWQESAELAADNGAVSSRKEALDLAAALIKISRYSPLRTVPDFATSFVSAGESTANRVERLLAWKSAPDQIPHRWRYAIFAVCVLCLVIALRLGPILALIHSITERFVP